MKKILSIYSLVLGGVMFALGAGIHPSYDIYNVRPDNFKPLGVGGMGFLPDGRLAITTMGHMGQIDGKVWLLSGVEGIDNTQVQVQEFASGLRESLGLEIVDGVIYVLQDHEVTKLTDANNDGTAELTTIATGWKGDYANNWAMGLAHKDGDLYYVLDAWNINNDADHGCMMKSSISATSAVGNYECQAGGFRSTNAMALGPENLLVTGDNQGNWNPSDNLYVIKPGRHYGFNTNTADLFINEPESPPTAALPHGDAALSISDPIFVRSGHYAGQMLAGDITKSGIMRYFLERVGGEYQSAAFKFCEGILGTVVDGINTEPGNFHAGTNRLEFGPNGDLYVGQLGGGGKTTNQGGPGGWAGNWSWEGTWTGLQKLRYKGTPTFEMLAIRSLTNGFEIEFTKPAGASATVIGNYTLTSWHNTPVTGYGGGHHEGSHALTISSATLSANNMKVTLQIDPNTFIPQQSWELKSSVIEFKVPNITSGTGEEIWTKEAWYTLNSIGPADVVGCTDQNSPAYNSNADYDDGIQCALTPVIKSQNSFNNNIRILSKNNGMLKLDLNMTSEFNLQLFDVNGKILKNIKNSSASSLDIPLLGNAGIFFIRVQIGDQKYHKTIYLD